MNVHRGSLASAILLNLFPKLKYDLFCPFLLRGLNGKGYQKMSKNIPLPPKAHLELVFLSSPIDSIIVSYPSFSIFLR